jgi:hypothetical protein
MVVGESEVATRVRIITRGREEHKMGTAEGGRNIRWVQQRAGGT